MTAETQGRGWLPIESGPKNGDDILLLREQGSHTKSLLPAPPTALAKAETGR